MRLKDEGRIFLESATVSGDISFIPGGFEKLKPSLVQLAKLKKQWGIQILEFNDSYGVVIEEGIRILVPKQCWHEFVGCFPGGLRNSLLDLTFLESGQSESLLEKLMGLVVF